MDMGDDIPDPFDEQGDFGMEKIELPDPFEGYKELDSLRDDPLAFTEPPAKRNKVSDQSTSKRSYPVVPPTSDQDDDTLPDIELPNVFQDFQSMSTNNFDDAQQKLHPTSALTTLKAIMILLSWFSSFPGISKNAFSRLLFVLRTFILPEGNNLPKSYSEAVKMVKDLMTPVTDYHCCVNDCILFRDCTQGKYSDLTKCPVCGEDRYQKGSKSKAPRKLFKYIPLEPRIRQWFGNVVFSDLLQSHQQQPKLSTKVSSIHQSQAWNEWYDKDGFFKGDPRALSFAICLDGTNPFAHKKTTYSMCPITLVPLNLPENLRNAQLLHYLSELYQDPNVYLDVLVDEVLHLNELVIYDALKKETFRLKVNITLYVFDYPGQNKVLKCQGANAIAGCSYCTLKGEYSKMLSKTVYLHHRTFLPSVDILCQSKDFPSTVLSPKPQPKTMAFVVKANNQFAKAKTKVEQEKLLQQTGCKGKYSLQRLPNHDRYLNTPVEPMHTIKNISERLVTLLAGKSDSAKVRAEEQSRGRFPTTWCDINEKRHKLLPAPFRLNSEELKVANQRCLSIVAPQGVDWKPRSLFSKKVSLKSNEWKNVLTCGILKFCLRGLLGEEQRKILFELCDVVACILAEEIDMETIESLEYRVHRVLSLLEKDFPVSIHVIMIHLLHHLPMYISRFGCIPLSDLIHGWQEGF